MSIIFFLYLMLDIAKVKGGSEQSRIVGGDFVDSPTRYPSLVHLNFIGCAGVIVTRTWVVTAAHCVKDIAIPLSSIKGKTLTAGQFNLQISESHEQWRTINLVIPHESYNNPVKKSHDIALLHIQPPLQFNDYVQPVKFPQPDSHFDSPEDNFSGWAVGWGRLSHMGIDSKRLMHVEVPILPSEKCFSIFDSNQSLGAKFDRDSMICAGFDEGGKDSCQGDSGGPFYYQDVANNNTQFLIGIISWGIRCAEPGIPGVYTRITSHLKWINYTIENPYDPAPSATESHLKSSASSVVAISAAFFLLQLNIR